jgi:hypothetical protein
MAIKLTNVSNPAAFGVEWAGESGKRYQLVNPRGTASLMMGAERHDGNGWANTPVSDPERFGMTSAPRTFAEFRRIAEAFTGPSPVCDECGATIPAADASMRNRNHERSCSRYSG